jgi:hypothetical protein
MVTIYSVHHVPAGLCPTQVGFCHKKQYRHAWASGTVPEAQGPKTADTPVEMKKSKSHAGGTAGAAVHPKTTDPTSWEVELP